MEEPTLSETDGSYPADQEKDLRDDRDRRYKQEDEGDCPRRGCGNLRDEHGNGPPRRPRTRSWWDEERESPVRERRGGWRDYRAREEDVVPRKPQDWYEDEDEEDRPRPRRWAAVQGEETPERTQEARTH